MSISDMVGKVFIIHGASSAIACGQLMRPTTLVVSSFETLSGSGTATGQVAVLSTSASSTVQSLVWSMQGCDTSCSMNCGLHVHEGMNCSNIGGHYWVGGND